MLPQNDAPPALHHIKRRAEHTIVIAEEVGPRRGRKHGGELRQHAILAAHVMCRLHLIAKRRTAKHQFGRLPVATNKSGWSVRAETVRSSEDQRTPASVAADILSAGQAASSSPERIGALPSSSTFVFMFTAPPSYHCKSAPTDTLCSSGSIRWATLLKLSSVIRSPENTNSVRAQLRIRQLISSAGHVGRLEDALHRHANEAARSKRHHPSRSNSLLCHLL